MFFQFCTQNGELKGRDLMRRYSIILVLLTLAIIAKAQFYGTVVDAATGEPIEYAAAKYIGTGIGTSTDAEGKFVLQMDPKNKKMEVSCLGYKSVTVTVNHSYKVMHSVIKMYSDDVLLSEVVVKKSKVKYKRKDNPAVDLMRRVIANKHLSDIKEKDFYHFDKYEKLTLSYNDVEKSPLAEVCPETGKLILPIMVDETVSEENYRRSTNTSKVIVNAKRSDGFQSMLSSGDMFADFTKDIFTDVNIYKDNVRVLQHPFISPISTSEAIGFYHYYIQDTIVVEGERCIDVVFLPNNTQDFGFAGHLFVTDDDKNQVKRAVINIPNNSGVNYVDNMLVMQDFATLPTGERVLKSDDMIVEVSGFYGTLKMMCQRNTTYSNYSFDAITDKNAFKYSLSEYVKPDAEQKDTAYWASVRPRELSQTESNLGMSVDRMSKKIGGLGKFLLAALVENSLELTSRPNKLDLIPFNSIISNNYIDGWRFKLPLQTTANLSPHLFLRGYAAYGTKDKQMKYLVEGEYSFNKKKYMAHEFPRHSISMSYMYDDMSPIDKYRGRSNDDVLNSFKVSKVDQMMYVNNIKLGYICETRNYFTFSIGLDNSKFSPAGELKYQHNVDGTLLSSIKTTDAKVGIRFAPREAYVNNKQKRLSINDEAPVFRLEHTIGLNGVLGGQYDYNMTEASIYKKFWLPSAFGYMEMSLKGGYQWNKVAFPMLFIPHTSTSYFVQSNSLSFNMLHSMEFLNDKYATLFLFWSFDGKLLNRLPLVNKMKLREFISFKMLYGGLSDKNNPFVSTNDNDLLRFPMRDGEYTSFVMGSKPYMEMSVGLCNIFKILTVQYVRRLTYNDTHEIPGEGKVKKNGLRFSVDLKF